MKKFVIFLLSLGAALSSHAYKYVSGQATGDENLLWSTCVWTNSEFIDDAPLPGKPSARDTVVVRTTKTLKCDIDVNITHIMTGSYAKFFAEKITFNSKRGILIRQTGVNASSFFEFKDCKVNLGGLDIGPVTGDQTTMGVGAYRFIDSTVNVAGDITSTIISAIDNKGQGKAGLEIYLEGSTRLIVKGVTILDSMYSSNPDFTARIILREKNGNVPFMQIKGIDAKLFDISVSVYSDLKKGKYPLLEILEPKSTAADFKSIQLKGRKYELGTDFKLGDRTARIELDAVARGNKNDLVLVVD